MYWLLLGWAVSGALAAVANNTAWDRQLECGRKLVSQGRYAEARDVFEQARKQAEQFGSEDTRLAAVLNDLGSVDYRLDDLPLAERWYRRSAAIWEARGDAEHAVAPLANLAGLYLTLKRYSAAEDLLRKALDIATGKLGPDHPQTNTVLAFQANLAFSRRDYNTAASLSERVVAGVWKTRGPADPQLAAVIGNLGRVYRVQGRKEESARLFLEAAQILERHGQPDHPGWIRALEDLSAVRFDDRLYDQAESLLSRSLEVAERALGPNHPEVGRLLEERATVMRKAGRKKEARMLETRARRIEQRSATDNALGYTVDLRSLPGNGFQAK
jgi:tetratricopeptide (TPR) repeat protein